MVHAAWEWTRALREQVLGPKQTRQGVQALLVDTAGKVVLGDAAGVRTGTGLQGVLAQAGTQATEVT